MAERVGFEPTVPVRYDGFQDRSVMTTSVSLHRCYNMLAYPRGYVNRFLRNFTHKKMSVIRFIFSWHFAKSVIFYYWPISINKFVYFSINVVRLTAKTDFFKSAQHIISLFWEKSDVFLRLIGKGVPSKSQFAVCNSELLCRKRNSLFVTLRRAAYPKPSWKRCDFSAGASPRPTLNGDIFAINPALRISP